MSDLEPAEEALEMEDMSAKMRLSRQGKMSHLTKRMNIVNTLMADKDGLDEVKENMVKFNQQLEDFKAFHVSFQQTLSAKDKSDDTKKWYTPRMEEINPFLDNVSKWIIAVESNVTTSQTELPLDLQLSAAVPDDKNDDDRHSIISIRSRTSARSNASVSSTKSARVVAEAEQVALLEKAKALEKRHSIEDEEAQLQAETQLKKEELRKKKEKVDMEAELKANTAKLQYLREAEEKPFGGSVGDAMNEYLEEQTVRLKDNVTVQFPYTPAAARTTSRIQPAVARTPAAPRAIGGGRP